MLCFVFSYLMFWPSWICGFVFVFSVEGSQSLLLQIFLQFLSLFLLLVFPSCVHCTFCDCPTVLLVSSSVSVSLFCLCIPVLKFLLTSLQAHWSFPRLYPVYWWVIKGVLYFFCSALIFRTSFWFVFSVSISLLTLPMCSCTWVR